MIKKQNRFSQKRSEGIYLKGQAETTYLQASSGERLTPLLAKKHPDIVSIYGVNSWKCSNCDAAISFTELNDDATKPLCPNCAANGELSHLEPPIKTQQGRQRNIDTIEGYSL